MGNSKVSCPQCGAQAAVPDGNYSFDDENKPGWTYFKPLTSSQVFRLRQTITWVRQEIAKPEPDEERAARVLEKTIEENAPQLRGFLDRLRDPAVGNVGAWVAILIAILMWLSQPQPDGISPDEVEQILERVVQSAQTGPTNQELKSPTGPAEQTPPEGPAPTVTGLPTPETR